MIGRKGLFGKGTPQYGLEGMTLPTMDQPMPNDISYTPMQMPQATQRPTSFWQGGDKFTLRDGLAGALAAVGDGLSGWAGNGTGAVDNLMGGREKAAKRAEALREQALRLAAGQRLGFSEDQMMLLGDNVGTVVAGRMKPQEPVAPRFIEDNAGNQWATDPMTGRPIGDRPVFVDTNPRTYFQNGAMITVPNVYAQQGGLQTAPDAPDTLPPDFFKGGTGGNVGGGFRR